MYDELTIHAGRCGKDAPSLVPVSGVRVPEHTTVRQHRRERGRGKSEERSELEHPVLVG